MRSRSSRSSSSRSSSRSSFSKSRSHTRNNLSSNRHHVSRSNSIHRHNGTISHGYYHTRHYHHGPTVHTSIHISPLTFLAGFVCFIGIIFIMIALTSLSSINTHLQDIKNSYQHYISMIEYAEIHPEYIREGEVIGIYHDDEYGKYYIEYKVIEEDFPYRNITKTSFSIYDETQKNDFFIGKKINIAFDTPNFDKFADTINMDYKDFSLEDNADYQYYLNKKTHNLFLFIGIGIIVAVIVTTIIMKIRKKKKASEQNPLEAPKEYENKCKYCGSPLPENSYKCSECGASRNDV